ncbi:MAG: glycosyltransferase family 2 protein, partial [Porcipelethomonas sp.]
MVSCIITTYKREVSILKRAVDSIVNQTYKDIEIIIVNDAPAEAELREEIRQMLDEYDMDIRYIVHDVNKGACAARNTGIKESSGEYIAFLDDDDEWLPEKIEKQIGAFKKSDSKTALVYCGRVTVNDTTGTIEERKAEFHEGFVFDLLIMRNFIGSTSYPLLRTDVLREVGGFDPQ